MFLFYENNVYFYYRCTVGFIREFYISTHNYKT